MCDVICSFAWITFSSLVVRFNSCYFIDRLITRDVYSRTFNAVAKDAYAPSPHWFAGRASFRIRQKQYLRLVFRRRKVIIAQHSNKANFNLSMTCFHLHMISARSALLGIHSWAQPAHRCSAAGRASAAAAAAAHIRCWHSSHPRTNRERSSCAQSPPGKPCSCAGSAGRDPEINIIYMHYMFESHAWQHSQAQDTAMVS